MENRIHWKTDEIQNLELEELESVAGGFEIQKLSKEDQQRYMYLWNRYQNASRAYYDGTGSRAKLDAAIDELNAFVASKNV